MEKQNIRQETINDVRMLYGLKCPMRDGIQISSDVYMPVGDGSYPTIILRTPYDNISASDLQRVGHLYFAQRGYAVVTQDVRGRYDSDGEWYPFVSESDDGYDSIDWVAKQSWCDGNVALIGSSYRGLTQWQAAQNPHPSLKAAVPRVAYSNTYHNWVYTGGAFQLAFNLSWSLMMSDRVNQPQHLFLPKEAHISTYMNHLPLITSDEAAGRNVRMWKDWINHPSYDSYWESMKPIDAHYADVDVAAYSMGGWFDVFLQGGLNNFMGVTKHGKTEKIRRSQKMIVGPWIHSLGALGTESITGDIDFGPEVLNDLQIEQLRWYDYWLRGIDNGIMDEPRVKVFVMGANRWRESDEWPIPGTKYTPYYFHSNGTANSLLGDGTLNRTKPGDEPSDHYTYDPNHPVMTIGGSTCCNEETLPVSMGPRDQRPNEYRPDVLVYSSDVLESDVEVTGPVKLILYASSSAKDTDFSAKLVDVFPDGYAMNVAQGIQRARYRDSWEKPALMTPGEVYKFEIDLWSTSNCFLKGHRIRVEVTSSNFPQFDRNPNTGNDFGQDAEIVKADQTILHDKDNPSHIILPIID